MNSAQLEATFAANKGPILAAAGAGVVGLALWRKKKTAASSASSSTAAPATATNPAGAASFYSTGGQTSNMSGGVAAYDSTASDLYGALSPQLTSIGQQLSALQGVQTLPVPAAAQPIAATLSKPSGTGNYVRYPNGTIAEVQSDGSLFGMTYGQWLPISQGGASYQQLPQAPSKQTYSSSSNLMAKINAGS